MLYNHIAQRSLRYLKTGSWGLKRDADGEWRRLHNEELHSLYSSLNILRVNMSRRLRCAGHVGRMEEGRSAFKILTGRLYLQESVL